MTDEITIEFEDRWPGCLEDERPPDRWTCTVTDRGLALSGIGFEQIDALMKAVRAHEMMHVGAVPAITPELADFYRRKVIQMYAAFKRLEHKDAQFQPPNDAIS